VKCIIIGNGEIKDYPQHISYIDEGDCIICADGGGRHALAMGLEPDYLMGDFDSLDPNLFERLKGLANPPELLKFPADKDKSDSELAVDFALSLKPDSIIIMGGTGSRLDHTLANITMLAKLPDVNIHVVNDNNDLYLTNDRAVIKGKPGDEVSILPLTPVVKGVTTKGLKWPLVNKTIEMGSSLGVSNVLLEDEAEFTLTEGKLLVLRSVD
jgi:thiamine pyrophosphokinase